MLKKNSKKKEGSTESPQNEMGEKMKIDIGCQFSIL